MYIVKIYFTLNIFKELSFQHLPQWDPISKGVLQGSQRWYWSILTAVESYIQRSPSGLTALVCKEDLQSSWCGILYVKESFRAHGVGIQRRPSGFMLLIWSILTAVGSYILGSLMMRVQLVNSSRHPVLTKRIWVINLNWSQYLLLENLDLHSSDHHGIGTLEYLGSGTLE